MSEPPRWVYDFGRDAAEGIGQPHLLLGGKGAALHGLAREGFSVPDGFTITTAACDFYYQQDRRWPDSLWRQIREGVARLERQTGRRFGRGAEPLLLAVRSGGPRSMPGLLESILDCGLTEQVVANAPDGTEALARYRRLMLALAAGVHGVRLQLLDPGRDVRHTCQSDRRQYLRQVGRPFPDEPWDMLRSAITAVWNSWYLPRAVAYREARGIPDTPRTAVQVQVMVPVDIGGVLRTPDPRPAGSAVSSERPRERIVIEAAAGGGQPLLAGHVTPCDELLSDEQRRRLTDEARRLETCFPGPLEVEWGWAGERLVIFQVRPARDENQVARHDAIRRHEQERLQRRISPGDVWVRHGLAETLPAPTPLTWDVIRRFMSGEGGYGRLYRRLGYRPARRLRDRGPLELAFGRIYADPERLVALFGEGLPMRFDIERLPDDPGLLERFPERFAPEATDHRFLPRLPGLLWSWGRVAWRLPRLARRAPERFETEVLPRVRRYLADERSRPLGELEDARLLELLSARRRRVLDELAVDLMLPGLLAGVAQEDLQRQLARRLGEAEARRCCEQLLLDSVGAGDAVAESYRRLARGELTRAEFLERWGHRGPGEMELARPRWRDDPSLLEGPLVERMPAEPLAGTPRRQEYAERQAAAERHLRQRLADEGAASCLPDILVRLERVRRLLPLRETGKDAWMMGYALLRDVLEELSRRWQLGTDIYFLKLAELPEFVAREPVMRERIGQRRERWSVLQRVALPPLLDAPRLASLLDEPRFRATAERLAGTPLSGGRARGPARHVTSWPVGGADEIAVAGTRLAAHDGETDRGYVLICPVVDPGITPLLVRACALVVETGGRLSHGALVARQLGIPAVACSTATRAIPAGASVSVDGCAGVVRWEPKDA